MIFKYQSVKFCPSVLFNIICQLFIYKSYWMVGINCKCFINNKSRVHYLTATLLSGVQVRGQVKFSVLYILLFYFVSAFRNLKTKESYVTTKLLSNSFSINR